MRVPAQSAHKHTAPLGKEDEKRNQMRRTVARRISDWGEGRAEG